MNYILILTLFLLSCSDSNDNSTKEIPRIKTAKELFRDSLKSVHYTNKFVATDKNHADDFYRSARLEMYQNVFNYSDTLAGVYSGYKHFYSTAEYSNPDPINCEHTIPQSFFNKKEPMRSDMHHLFPTHKDINSKRSNYKFAEIDDSKTTNWMIFGTVGNSSKPTLEIDTYSEFYNNTFEPREDHKGNVARAIFYFFTMYPEITGSTGIKNTITSVANIETLKSWHIADPADSEEKLRQDGIEAYQGNRNPYVDDASLAEKSW